MVVVAGVVLDLVCLIGVNTKLLEQILGHLSSLILSIVIVLLQRQEK
nr:MAG TPA: hypothetical protein [Caudoviricetes sp.]